MPRTESVFGKYVGVMSRRGARIAVPPPSCRPTRWTCRRSAGDGISRPRIAQVRLTGRYGGGVDRGGRDVGRDVGGHLDRRLDRERQRVDELDAQRAGEDLQRRTALVVGTD